MSLESALRETEQRFYEAKEAERAEQERGQTFVKRIIFGRRFGLAKAEHVSDLRPLMPEGAYIHLEALRSSYPNMGALILSSNTSTFSSLGGHVLALRGDEKIVRVAHLVNGKSPFGITLGVLLPQAAYTSARDFRERYGGKLASYVRTLEHTGPTLAEHYARGGDAQRWPAFFPTKRTHVGVYAADDGRMYLVMRSHAGTGVLDGVRAVAEESGMTAERFVTDTRIKWMEGVAYRNAARVLHGVARFLGFTTPTTHDYSTYTGPSRLDMYRAVEPTLVMRHDTQRMTDCWGAPRAVFFRDAIDGAQCKGDTVLIQSDITQGYSMADRHELIGASMLPVLPLTTDKIASAERSALTVDQRDEYADKIASVMPRASALAHYKYKHPSGRKLTPLDVVRS